MNRKKPAKHYCRFLSLRSVWYTAILAQALCMQYGKHSFGYHPLAVVESNILGVLSLLFWTVMLLISVKYIGIMMRADNRGEGGSLALLALVLSHVRKKPRLSIAVSIMGIFAASLFYGDSMITPAISVLSAVEGLHVIAPALEKYVLPITIAIITISFSDTTPWYRSTGTCFWAIIAIWFSTIALLGALAIIKEPQILVALNPVYAFSFFYHEPLFAFLSLGAVVLAVTGGEVLYADMGHFGKMPIRLTWFGFVMPSLILNYFGQGALLLQNPDMIANPFYLLAPEWGRIPLLVLATAAAIIASQAVISGAFLCSAPSHANGSFTAHDSSTNFWKIPGANFMYRSLTGCSMPLLSP